MNTITHKLVKVILDVLFDIPNARRVISVGLLPGPEDADRPVLVTVEVQHG